MQLIDGRLVYSASDLVGFLACGHLTNLERAAAAGLVRRPMREDKELALMMRRGVAHEQRYLAELRAAGSQVTLIESEKDEADEPRDRGPDWLREAAERTLAALRRGDEVIYQAALFDGRWRGHADFLRRVKTPSALGRWSYEVHDTKLARQTKAGALLQLCLYSDLLGALQGLAPALMHVALGGSEQRRRESHRVSDYAAYYRMVKRQFEEFVSGEPVLTLPDPVERCDVCRWSLECQGIDYLFGVLEPGLPDAEGNPTFHPIWARDADGRVSLAAEKRAFEKLIDLLADRRERDPNLHIYHYGPYEPTAIGRLMGRHATRELEVDGLLRGQVFVDLYRAFRQGLRASVESYSIKRLEPLYDFERTVDLRDAGACLVEFATWMETAEEGGGDGSILERIEGYNQDDCRSAWKLRDWLEDRQAIDPATKKSCGTVFAVSNREGTIDIKRGKGRDVPHPTSIIPELVVKAEAQEESLLRTAQWVVANGIDGSGNARAARDLLLRRPPRFVGAAVSGRPVVQTVGAAVSGRPAFRSGGPPWPPSTAELSPSLAGPDPAAVAARRLVLALDPPTATKSSPTCSTASRTRQRREESGYASDRSAVTRTTPGARRPAASKRMRTYTTPSPRARSTSRAGPPGSGRARSSPGS